MDMIAAAGYQTVTVSELAAWLWEGPEKPPGRVVAITFDDGFADFYDNAWPHLRRNGLKSTMFVSTAYVGSTSTWLKDAGEGDRPLMSWEQIREIAAAGVEVGAHSHHHLQLDTVSRARAAAEIELSRRALGDAIGPVASFAYPHGYHTRAVRRAVHRAGFTSACAVGDGLASSRDDRFAITRAIVESTTTLDRFAAILDARYPSSARRPLRRAAWRGVRRAALEARLDRLDWVRAGR